MKMHILISVGLGLAFATSGVASATIVDISAGPEGYGCTTCFGGPPSLGSAPGNVVVLDNENEAGPLQLTLAAGTYSITNAATTGAYSGWRYDGGDDWAWNFAIGIDNGNNTATILDVGSVGDQHYSSQEAIADATDVPSYSFGTVLNPSTSTADYYDTFTLSSAATLDFFVIDGYLADNAGGVALDIQSVSAAPEPSTWALMITGLGLIGGTLRLGRRREELAASAG